MALVHNCKLFYAVKLVDKDINRWEQKMRYHLARKPLMVRARSIFYREAMAVLRERAGGAGRVAPRIAGVTQQR